jgi:hypothetical protein
MRARGATREAGVGEERPECKETRAERKRDWSGKEGKGLGGGEARVEMGEERPQAVIDELTEVEIVDDVDKVPHAEHLVPLLIPVAIRYDLDQHDHQRRDVVHHPHAKYDFECQPHKVLARDVRLH